VKEHDRNESWPAALPLIFFIAGLELHSRAVNPNGFMAGVAAIASALLLVRRFRRPAAVPALFCLLGALIGSREGYLAERTTRAFAGLDRAGFVTVTAPMERDWELFGKAAHGEATYRMTVRRFSVSDGRTEREFVEPLTIWCTDPPDIGLKREIVAEGFLRRKHGRFSLSVKSPLLLSYRGETGPMQPRFWNRMVSQRLESFAGKSPRTDDAIILARALALGRSDRLPEELKRSYRSAGTYHLLVFSGMQIAFAAAFLAIALRLLWSPRAVDFALLTLALLAPLFAGSEPSVSRSAWMIGLYALSRILRRPTSTANLLFVSALVRLIAVPDELHDASFALTYAATGGLILAGGALASLVPAEWRAARVLARGIGAELATTPLSMYYFSRFTVGGSLVTILIAPVIATMLFCSVALILSAFLLPAAIAPLSVVLVVLDRGCRVVNDFFASTLGLAGLVAAPALLFVVGGFATHLALVLLLPKPRRAWSVPALLAAPLAALLTTLLFERPQQTRLEALDVGQGDAILLRAPLSTILVDGGGRAGDEAFGNRVLLPLLLSRHVRRLDLVVLSHAHPDHCGGLATVVRELEVGCIVLSGRQSREECAADLIDAANERGVPVRVAEHVRSHRTADVNLDITVPRLRFKRSPLNNGSVVVRAAAPGLTALLPGDVESDAERLLLEEWPHLAADVLKVPHHGSRTSTTSDFLSVVRPRVTLISCGLDNLYGHPHPSVVERLSSRGCSPLRTDRNGTVVIEQREGHFFTTREFDWPRSAE
jgi:competence protein ComEC